MTTADAPHTLRGLLPAERERPVADYPIDGRTPAIALRPESREEVATVLAAADAAGIAVAPQGARTALRLGRPLAAYDVALDLTALDRVVAYDPADMTATVEAGMRLADLQALLAEHGQELPADPPPDDSVTIGGLLATARPGAARGHLPAARDLVLGITVALPDGALVRSGGRVVKNVSGYDLHRMQTGALGALGVIVEASFKLAARTARPRSFAIRCAALVQASEVAFTIRDAALPTRGLSLLSAEAAVAAGLPAAAHCLVEFGGAEETIARCETAVREAATRAGASVDEPPTREADAHTAPTQGASEEPWARLRTLAAGDAAGDPDSDAVVVRLGVPATEIASTIAFARDAGWTAWGHLAAGSVLARRDGAEPQAIEALRTLAVELHGFLQIESAPAALRERVDPFAMGEVELVRALKQQFDPHGTLNRGRWMEGV